jgi:hypothetical protein
VGVASATSYLCTRAEAEAAISSLPSPRMTSNTLRLIYKRNGGRQDRIRQKTRKIGGPEGSTAKARRRADLESVARLASHELEGAMDEGARVAEGGAVVVHHHNVEQLRRRHGAVAGDRRQKGRWRGPVRRFPLSLLSPCSGPPAWSVGLVLIRWVSLATWFGLFPAGPDTTRQL